MVAQLAKRRVKRPSRATMVHILLERTRRKGTQRVVQADWSRRYSGYGSSMGSGQPELSSSVAVN